MGGLTDWHLPLVEGDYGSDVAILRKPVRAPRRDK
jgi:hypothetical protein